LRLNTKLSPALKLEIPIMIAQMSYGAISVEAHEALARAGGYARHNYGSERGLHKSYTHMQTTSLCKLLAEGLGSPCLSRAGAAVEIKIGQGAKTGIGGHLPGTKITDEYLKRDMDSDRGRCHKSAAPRHLLDRGPRAHS